MAEERYSGPERREDAPKPSAWQDPRFWVSVLGILLTVLIFIGSLLLKQIADLNANVTSLNNTQIRLFTAQGKDIDHLENSQREMALRLSANETNQNAYNFRIHGQLTEIVTTLKLRGIPISDPPPPPQLGGK